MLTGKYQRGIPEDSRSALPGYGWLRRYMLEGERGERRRAQVGWLELVAKEAGIALAQMAIA